VIEKRSKLTSPSLACALSLFGVASLFINPATAQAPPLDRASPAAGADPARPKRAAPKPVARAPEKRPEPTPEKKPAGPGQDKAKVPEKKDPPPPVLQPGEVPQAPLFQALIHARQAGLAACTDTLTRLLPQLVDAPHDAFSFWSTQNADDHLFGPIAALSYPQPSAPRGASIVLATPAKSGKCEAAGVQIVPTARSCGVIQAALMNAGRAIANLEGLPLIENPAGVRYMLAPPAGNGCIVIAITVLLPK
jgi:hypothetical protein